MKFAFMLMGDFKSKECRTQICEGSMHMVGVSSIEEACDTAKKLWKDGFGCIELCGAFGEEGARKVIAATENQVAIGYVVHLPEQDELFAKAFPAG